ncbi:hypothetical protein FQA39_LY15472 [Lamprigera yunnana]|nr:hypothetical protein FQA39_LY15472 [Lamprigera yunnana]
MNTHLVRPDGANLFSTRLTDSSASTSHIKIDDYGNLFDEGKVKTRLLSMWNNVKYEIYGNKRNVYPEILLSENIIIEQEPEQTEIQLKAPSEMLEKHTKLISIKKGKMRNDVLKGIRKDRKKYYNERIKLQKDQFVEKINIESEKLKQLKHRNELIKTRNDIYEQFLRKNIDITKLH